METEASHTPTSSQKPIVLSSENTSIIEERFRRTQAQVAERDAELSKLLNDTSKPEPITPAPTVTSEFTILAKPTTAPQVKFPFLPKIKTHTDAINAQLPALLKLADDLIVSPHLGADKKTDNRFRDNILRLQKLCGEHFEVNSEKDRDKLIREIWEEVEKTPQLMIDSLKSSFQDLATPKTDEKEESARQGILKILGKLGEGYYGIAKEMDYELNYTTGVTPQKITDFIWTFPGYSSVVGFFGGITGITVALAEHSTGGLGFALLGGVITGLIGGVTALITDGDNPFNFDQKSHDIQNNYRTLGNDLNKLDYEKSRTYGSFHK